MLSDLAFSLLIGAIALLVVGGLLLWVGQQAESGKLRRGFIGIPTAKVRHSDEAWALGHDAAAPFLKRYGVIVAGLSALVILFSFVSDILALIVYILDIAFLVLGCMVFIRKANDAAGVAVEDEIVVDESADPEVFSE